MRLHVYTEQLNQFFSKRLNYSSTYLPPVFIFFLLGWILINALQAWLTPISEDEAYYWMYSRMLDWGYFDHPPMIALWIKAGNLLLDGEIGSRLVAIIAQPLCLIFLWLTLRDNSPSVKNILLFFGIAASIVMFEVFGFFSTPDAPLFFFTSLFLFGYRRFLHKESSLNILLLAVSMAGMLYSKYHGALVILFVLASNPGLLLKWKFWLACLMGALLFLPHMLWQVYHHFPTLEYHLVTRARPFKMRNILEYWPNQLLTFNPLFFGLTIFILFRFRPVDIFERALYFISAGFLGFFFLASLRGHIEPHWTAVSCLAMLLLVYRHSLESSSIRRFVNHYLFPSIVLLIFLRFTLIFDLLPIGLKLHGQKEWSVALGAQAADHPVVFFNSYQHPSLYTYYTGKPATTLDGVSYKQTQYDLWNFDESYQGQKVILVSGKELPSSTPIAFPHGRKKFIYPVDNFITVRKIQISYNLAPGTSMKPGDSITLDATLLNPYPFNIDFRNDHLPITFQASFLQHGKLKKFAHAIPFPDMTTVKAQETQNVRLTFQVPEIPQGKYFFGIVLKTGVIDGTFNSNFIPVNIFPTDAH